MEATTKNQHNAKVAIICAGISVVAWIIPIAGIPLSIVALVFGFKGKAQTAAKIAIVIASVTLLAGIVNAGIGAKNGVEHAKQIQSSQR